MPITMISALVGVVLLGVSLLQSTPLVLRYASLAGMFVCEVVFVWTFMLLGIKG
jgi:hypothetical protein